MCSCMHSSLFDEGPARRDYENLTASAEGGLFPMKWCSHRWLVAERAISMLPALKWYIKAVDQGKTKKTGADRSGPPKESSYAIVTKRTILYADCSARPATITNTTHAAQPQNWWPSGDCNNFREISATILLAGPLK